MMETQNDLDIYRYFDDIDEPWADDAFVETVNHRISRLRRLKRLKQGLVILAGLIPAAVLFPWIVQATSFLTLSVNGLTDCVVKFAISPIAWVGVFALLLPFIVLLRYYANKIAFTIFEFSG